MWWYWWNKNVLLGEEPIKLTVFPLEFPHALTWNWADDSLSSGTGCLNPVVINCIIFFENYKNYINNNNNNKFADINICFSLDESMGCDAFRGIFAKILYLLIHSMVQSPSWAANWFAASQEIPRISRNPKDHYRTHAKIQYGKYFTYISGRLTDIRF